jgi:hypothetical protein
MSDPSTAEDHQRLDDEFAARLSSHVLRRQLLDQAVTRNALAGLPEALWLAADEEAARMELAAIIQPSAVAVLTFEVRRRAALIEELRRGPLAWSPQRMTPFAAALRSVAADVAAGRLP